jgi:dephospho-CoA kinase
MLIGITGYKRSGKDTVAQIMVQHSNFERYAFADTIKAGCKVLFDWNDDHVYGDLKEEIDPRWGVSPRQMLQIFGTEIFQYGIPKLFPEYAKIVGRSFWVKRTFAEIEKNKDTNNIVIPDVRFHHEVDAIRARGGLIFKVVRSGYKSDGHESEEHIKEIDADYTILNNDTLEQLESVVYYLLTTLRKIKGEEDES